MSTMEISDAIVNEGQTEVLLPYKPEVIEEVLTEQANVLVKSCYGYSYEYVIAPAFSKSAVTLTFCETDDEDSIQTEYDMTDFLPDENLSNDGTEDAESKEPTRNTVVFSQEDPETIQKLFSQYTVSKEYTD